MAELWAKIEFNPIDFINPTKTWGVKICDLRYATYPHKMQPNKFQVITMRYGQVIDFPGWVVFAAAMCRVGFRSGYVSGVGCLYFWKIKITQTFS